MLLRLSLTFAVFSWLLSAQAPRTETDPVTLEARVESNPEDVTARAQLIRTYAYSRSASIPADRIRSVRRKNVLWMVEHHPENPVLAEQGSLIEKSGGVLADADGWAEIDAAWRRVLAAAPDKPAVFANAIQFYKTADRAFALKIAAQGLEAFPKSGVINGAKGAVLAYTLLGVRNLDQYGRATSFDEAVSKGREAAAAQREIEASRDADLVGRAAMVLSQQQMPLAMHNHRQEADDAAALSEELFQRAIELAPNEARWKQGLMSTYQLMAAQKHTSSEKIPLLEKAVALVADDATRTWALPDLASAYYDAGDLRKASETANTLLDAARRNSGGNYGGAVHTGNIVLGRVALKQNNIEEAKARLLAAGRTPGSAVLGSFGPNWNLAQDLLSKGERDTVLAYIDLCRVFWKSGQARLDAWAATLHAGGSPNFFGAPDVSRTQLVGKPAPDFRVKTLGGAEMSLGEFKGKVVLLDFWATWCAPCRAEMPEFEKLHREFAGKDVVILAVDSNEPEDTVAEFIRKEKYTFPVLLTEGTDVIGRYGINAYPTTMAVDKAGRVAEVVVGNSSNVESRLRAAIARARTGAPAPAPEPVVAPAALTLPAPVTTADFYRDGFRLRAGGDLSGALAAFDRALALRKNWPAALVARGDCLYQLKRYDDAIAALTEAIRIDPGHSVSYAVRGRSYLELGRTDDAGADLDKAIELDPSNETALDSRSRLNVQRKQYSQAIADCDAALRVNPRSAWAVSRRAEAQRAMSGAPALAAPKLLSPAAGAVFDHYPRQTELAWSEVPGAASYMVEWDFKYGESWNAEAHQTQGATVAAREPSAGFSFVGAQPGRWRVWAIDAAGQPGTKSEWREFRYTH